MSIIPQTVGQHKLSLIPGVVSARIDLLTDHVSGYTDVQLSSKTEVTKVPLESGAPINDHSYVLPQELTMTGHVSGVEAGPASAREAWAIIRQLQEQREPLTVVTPLTLLRECIITRATGDPFAAGGKYQLTIKQVIRLGIAEGEIDPLQVAPPSPLAEPLMRDTRVARPTGTAPQQTVPPLAPTAIGSIAQDVKRTPISPAVNRTTTLQRGLGQLGPTVPTPLTTITAMGAGILANRVLTGRGAIDRMVNAPYLLGNVLRGGSISDTIKQQVKWRARAWINAKSYEYTDRLFGLLN